MKNKNSFSLRFPGILLLIVSCLHFFSEPASASNKIPVATPATIVNTTICNNQLPYSWNGITCLVAGSYTATLTGSNGADSVVVLNLSVINVGTSITNAVICDNELPYHWNGNIYSSSGTYSVTLTSSSGCDSVPILSLTVNHVVTSITNSTICSNELPFSWNGNNYPVAGTYSVTLSSSAGCDSIATLNLSVNQVSSSVTNATVCINQLPYHWNGQSYPAAGNYSVVIPASNGCDSTVVLNLSTTTTTSSNTSASVCSNQLPYNWNGQAYMAAGTYSVNLTGTSGCDSVATLLLSVKPVLITNWSANICTAQLPYSWNGNSYAAAGNYQVTLTASSGCDSIAKLHLFVFDFFSSTTNQAICDSELPYTWNGNSYTTSGVYTASFITAAGCDSIATLNLDVVSLHVDTDSLIICENELPYNYHGHIITAAGDYSIVPPFAMSPCLSIDSINVVILPVVTSTTSIAVCNNQLPFIWNGNAYNAAGTYTANLTSTAGCDSIADLNLTVNTTATSSTNLSICSSQVPYLWNGNLYNSTGTYTATLITAGGCDSIATLNLIVNTTFDTTVNLIICSTQTPYNWNGNNYSSSGNYMATLTSSGGCDSIVTLNLEVQSFLASTTNINICDNLLPYSWNGNSYAGPGIYSVTLASSAGCDSVATLNLVVNPFLTSTTTVDICSTQLPYTWNGNSYPTGGIYAVTLITSGGCDSIATLNLIEHSTLTTTTDLTICNNQLPFSWNGNSYPQAGVYPVTLTSNSGCDSIAVLNLTVTDILTSTTNVNLCPGQLPYLWNGNSYPTGGTYSVTLHNANGCDSVPILSLTVVPYVTSETDMTICNNDLPFTWNGDVFTTAGTYSVLLTGISCDSLATLNLSVDPPITSTTNISICSQQFPYTWNGNSYTAPGAYQVTLTSSGGCDSIATLNLMETTATSSVTDFTICATQLPYVWNGNSYSSAGTYSITLTSSSGCDSIATLNLTTNLIDTSITNLNICTNQLPFTWNGNSYASEGTYYVTLSGNDGCDSVATLILSATNVVTNSTNITTCDNNLPYSWNGNDYTIGGTYSVTFTGSSGCDSIATLDLVVNPVVTSNTNISICDNQIPYTWNGQDYTVPGTYSITLTSNAGCDSIATLNLFVSSVVTSNTNASICDNELPYLWNGQSYMSGGTDSIILSSTAGCDSIAILNLIINTADTSTTNLNICTNQLPYIWNGNSYSTDGTYYVQLAGNDGCDSVATLILSATAVVTSTTNISTCDNNLPYSWNGNDYTTAGSYSITFTSSSGCDSIATLILEVNSFVTSSTNIGICDNQIPYTWNGQDYTVSGTYSVTLTTVAGCDSIATLNLVISPVSTSNTNASTCDNELPYMWNGQSYTSAGMHSIILTSTAGCDSIVTLNLIINRADTSITNLNLCSNQLPYIWNGNSYSASGIYYVSLNGNDGCDSVATLILSATAVVTSTTNINTCDNNLPYSWNGNDYTTAGSYSIMFTSSSGCDSIATLILEVNPFITSNTTISICNNQVPYSWNGQNYTVSGTYSVTLTSADGCDSIATLNLSINSFITSNTNASTCDNELPYMWNGQSYTSAGIYSITLTGISGCDSIATLNLSINSVDTSNTNASTCDNQLPYIWNGNSYSTGGTYYVSLTGNDGCDSIATLILAVNPAVSSITNISVCDNNLPYSWNGSDYTGSGTYSITFTSSGGCDSIATLILEVNPFVTSNTSISICDNQLPYLWNGQSYTSAGTHSVTLTSAAGCDSIATLNLIINTVVTSNTIESTCDNQLPYLWNGQSFTSGGTHSITLTSAAGCDSIAILQLAIHPVTSSNTNFSICSAELPYNWNGQSYTASGTYTITLTNSSGCDSIATLQLTVNPTPGPPAVLSPLTYCQYDATAPLAATTTVAGSYLLWYTAATGGTGVTSAPIPSSGIAGTTNYYVSQVNGPCEGPRALITVTINSKPALGPDKDLKICFGQSANLTTLFNITGNSINWTYNQQPVADPTQITVEGSYQLIAINNMGCSDTVFVNLGIQLPLIANAGNDADIEYNVPYQLSGSGGGQYQWSPSNLLSNPYTASPVVTLTDSATFVLMVMDDVGCFDLDTVKLRVLNGPTFYVPSAFTPNGDGVNDIFRPTAVGIAELHFFRVFNRYGELVYETTEIGKGWDGIYKGIKQNTGNFVWSLRGTDRKGQDKIMKGNVILIR